jgi:hypothetical protein
MLRYINWSRVGALVAALFLSGAFYWGIRIILDATILRGQ